VRLTDQKRQNIIAGAIEEFQQHGFRGAKTTRIAKRAKVSSRTLYKHFESKEALFDSISEMIISQKTNVNKNGYCRNVNQRRTIKGILLAARSASKSNHSTYFRGDGSRCNQDSGAQVCITAANEHDTGFLLYTRVYAWSEAKKRWRHV